MEAARAGSSRTADDFADAYSPTLTIDGRFGARWIAQGSELLITLARPTEINRVFFSSDRSGAAGEHPIAAFVTDYEIGVSLDGEQWSTVASSEDRLPLNEGHKRQRFLRSERTDHEQQQLQSLRTEVGNVEKQIDEFAKPPTWWVGQFSEAQGPFHVFLGGSPQKPGEPVAPASLSSLENVASPYRLAEGTPESQRRLALAKWIVSPDNPLTPRVLANRIWHYHFGQGIVNTPSDFGVMGGRPTHPELLDWLAGRIPVHGWRLKELHRTIMLSQTYRQASTYNAEAMTVDADSRYLSAFPASPFIR